MHSSLERKVRNNKYCKKNLLIIKSLANHYLSGLSMLHKNKKRKTDCLMSRLLYTLEFYDFRSQKPRRQSEVLCIVVCTIISYYIYHHDNYYYESNILPTLKYFSCLGQFRMRQAGQCALIVSKAALFHSQNKNWYLCSLTSN